MANSAVVVSLTPDVNYKSGSSRLNKDAREAIDGLAEKMKPKRWRGGGGSSDDGDDDDSTDSGIGDTKLPHLFGGKAIISSISSLPEDEEASTPIDLLVEIVSASNLPVADIFSSDPYVVVRDGTKELHRTQVLQKK